MHYEKPTLLVTFEKAVARASKVRAMSRTECAY